MRLGMTERYMSNPSPMLLLNLQAFSILRVVVPERDMSCENGLMRATFRMIYNQFAPKAECEGDVVHFIVSRALLRLS